MNIFYNKDGIGDVLIIPFEDGTANEMNCEVAKDVAKITSNEGKLLGYNIFNASTYFPNLETGQIELTEEWVKNIEEVFAKNGLKDSLDIDLSPKFVVGFVKDKVAHENADKLSVCQVDVGEEQLQIVCGAKNVDKGQKVVVAKIGATMPSGLQIKPTELRGVPSNGMICSREELGLEKDPNEDGIYVLSDDETVGTPFEF